ncbi:MAG: hypothetical protein AABX28_01875 [Nanoarchaeota archaeon]
MITYNDIYEASRKERNSEQLQELPKNFIGEFAEYMREKKEFSFKEDDSFSDVVNRTKKQIENAMTIFKELMLRRKRKILNLILIAAETGISKKDFDNMLDFEKELFEELMKCIDSSDKKVNSNMFNNREKTDDKQIVLFKGDVDEFLGIDGGMMGPFKSGETAKIPKEIAQILIEDGKAELLIK